MCVVFLCLVAFVPWPGSSNIVASVSCVALVHFTVRATLEAILEHGAPGLHGDRPAVSRDPLPSVCPPGSWGSGCREPPRCPWVPLSRRARGRDNAGHRCWGRPAGGEKAFWSNLGYFCHVQTVVSVLGTRAGTSLSWRHRGANPADAPQVTKGSESWRLGNRLGFLFLFFPDLGGRSQLLGESQARPPLNPLCRPRSDRASPAALGSGGSCF